jgi:hypothetical protein
MRRRRAGGIALILTESCLRHADLPGTVPPECLAVRQSRRTGDLRAAFRM